MKKINTPDVIVQSNQKLWFLPPLYRWFGKLDNAQLISSLSEKNKKTIWDLQNILVNKDGQNANILYVADLWITTTLSNLDHNNIELMKLYTWVIKELREDFDVKLLSTTELSSIMAKFYGVESGLLPKNQLNDHLKLMDHFSVKYFHHFVDKYYNNSSLYTPVYMNTNFDPAKWNIVEVIK